MYMPVTTLILVGLPGRKTVTRRKPCWSIVVTACGELVNQRFAEFAEQICALNSQDPMPLKDTWVLWEQAKNLQEESQSTSVDVAR